MTEFAGRISRYRPERAGVCSATRPACRTPDGIPYWTPLDLNPYLYFDARVNVSTEGGEVDLWYPQWYGGTAPPNGLSDYLDQGTAEWKPIHSTDGYIQFDNVDTRLEYDPPVSQAGVLICATDNGIFAYEVAADSVDEITALGFETGYFQTLKLYAMTLLPATVSDVQIAGVIQYFEEELGATRNPTGSLESYWRNRTDLVTPKFDALDFSGATSFRQAWRGTTAMTTFGDCTFSSDASDDLDFTDAWRLSGITDFPALNLSRGTSFLRCWENNDALETFGAITFSTTATDDINFQEAFTLWNNVASFPALNLSRGTNFTFAWRGNKMTSFGACIFSTTVTDDLNFTGSWKLCDQIISFPSVNQSRGTNFHQSWYGCGSLENFPANFFDYWSPGTPATNCFVGAWDVCPSLTATSVENILNSIATSGVDAPASGPDITIDYDDGTGPPDITSAVTTLKACSPAWTITLNGVLQ